MKRYSTDTKVKEIESSADDLFIEDVIEVYKKHGLSISHEDGHGAFLIEPISVHNIEWLRDAMDNTTNYGRQF